MAKITNLSSYIWRTIAEDRGLDGMPSGEVNQTCPSSTFFLKISSFPDPHDYCPPRPTKALSSNSKGIQYLFGYPLTTLLGQILEITGNGKVIGFPFFFFKVHAYSWEQKKHWVGKIVAFEIISLTSCFKLYIKIKPGSRQKNQARFKGKKKKNIDFSLLHVTIDARKSGAKWGENSTRFLNRQEGWEYSIQLEIKTETNKQKDDGDTNNKQ